MPLDVDIVLDLDGLKLTSKGRTVRASASVAKGQTGRSLFAKLPSDQSSGLRPGDSVSVSTFELDLPNVAAHPSSALDSHGFLLVVEDGRRPTETKVKLLRKQGNEFNVEG